jgi:5-methylcytosine-specific restriction endonuclease McrA
VDKIRRCASDLGVTEYDVVAILWPGCHDAQDVVDWTYRYTRDRLNRYVKSKPDYKQKYLERNARPEVKARQAAYARAHSKFQGDIAAFHAHRRATLDANRSKAVEAQGKHILTPQEKVSRESSRLLKSARAQLRVINISLNRIGKELKRNSTYSIEVRRQANLPWRLAGFLSSDAWIEATHEGKEWQRTMWQARSHRRDAKVRGLPGNFTDAQWRAMMKEWDYRCAYCGRHRKEFRDPSTRTDLEIDHILPIGHPRASNDESNIVPACKTCNSSKSDSDLIVWAKRVGSFVHPWAMFKYLALVTTESVCQA